LVVRHIPVFITGCSILPKKGITELQINLGEMASWPCQRLKAIDIHSKEELLGSMFWDYISWGKGLPVLLSTPNRYCPEFFDFTLVWSRE